LSSMAYMMLNYTQKGPLPGLRLEEGRKRKP
jgi:hypothetical protein